jgi:hypothetical protein
MITAVERMTTLIVHTGMVIIGTMNPFIDPTIGIFRRLKSSDLWACSGELRLSLHRAAARRRVDKDFNRGTNLRPVRQNLLTPEGCNQTLQHKKGAVKPPLR